MLIGKKYKLEGDALNITLSEKVINARGKNIGGERWIALGYFSKPQHALEALVDLKVRETKLKDIKEVCRTQQELYDMIKKLDIPVKIKVRAMP